MQYLVDIIWMFLYKLCFAIEQQQVLISYINVFSRVDVSNCIYRCCYISRSSSNSKWRWSATTCSWLATEPSKFISVSSCQNVWLPIWDDVYVHVDYVRHCVHICIESTINIEEGLL